MLDELPFLAKQDENFIEVLQSLSFVPTESGKLKCPTELYDPGKDIE
jgi:hypothetical protein